MLFGKKQKPRDELHDYWRNPDEMNVPSGYFQAEERSAYLVSLVKQYAKPDASILELGCNVGRNLHYLWHAGYHNLSGVEINEQAIRLMKERFQDMQITIYQGTIEDRIKELGQYDVLFTMAVLEHIHTDSEWIFAEMVKASRKYIITIEDEKHTSERHFPRNYKKIFEPLGCKQIFEKQLSTKEGLGPRFYARVFVK